MDETLLSAENEANMTKSTKSVYVMKTNKQNQMIKNLLSLTPYARI